RSRADEAARSSSGVCTTAPQRCSGIPANRARRTCWNPARTTSLCEQPRPLVHRDSQADLADVGVAARVAEREPVPVRAETDAVADSDVVPQAEQCRHARFTGAAETRDAGAHRPQTETTGQEEAARRRRVEANRRGQRADRERRAVFRLGPSVGRNAEQDFLTQGPAERDVAAQCALTAATVLAPERAVPKPATE